MEIGVYSEIARLPLRAIRARARHLGTPSSPADLERIRERLMFDDEYSEFRKYMGNADWYSLSCFRDLLFHVHERSYTIPMIADLIEAVGLSFLGFDLWSPEVERRYIELFPDDPHLTDFVQWRAFEPHYTGTMELFRFLLQKPE